MFFFLDVNDPDPDDEHEPEVVPDSLTKPVKRTHRETCPMCGGRGWVHVTE